MRGARDRHLASGVEPICDSNDERGRPHGLHRSAFGGNEREPVAGRCPYVFLRGSRLGCGLLRFVHDPRSGGGRRRPSPYSQFRPSVRGLSRRKRLRSGRPPCCDSCDGSRRIGLDVSNAAGRLSAGERGGRDCATSSGRSGSHWRRIEGDASGRANKRREAEGISKPRFGGTEPDGQRSCRSTRPHCEWRPDRAYRRGFRRPVPTDQIGLQRRGQQARAGHPGCRRRHEGGHVRDRAYLDRFRGSFKAHGTAGREPGRDGGGARRSHCDRQTVSAGREPRPPGRLRCQRRRQEKRGCGAPGGRSDGRYFEVFATNRPDHRSDRRNRVPDQSACLERGRRGCAGGRGWPRLRGGRFRSARAGATLGRSGQGRSRD